MLVSYEWLQEYVDLTGISSEDIAEELNRTGIEVEVIYTRDAGVTRVVVGKVLTCEPHPEADRLNVCMVHVGLAQPLQIVCGAKNVAAGQLVPVALEGAKLPGDVRIKRTKLRGVESNGMICSAKELGLPDKVLMKSQQEGILVLGNDARIGQDIKQYLGMNDQAIELQLTPNRSDCLSLFGVAYEVAAIFDREMFLPEVTVEELTEEGTNVSITLQNEEDCPLYTAQVVRNLRIGPSPQWMQNRLISAGIRPINNIVDITNYVMIETGQPLHAYDYDRIGTGNIVVRRAVSGEQVVTLDGVTRTCDDQTLLITDGQEILGLAGIMGGESSEVSDVTTTVLLESAYFDPQVIRRTSRAIGLRSEANHRFERGVNPQRVQPALARAVQLLCELAGGEIASEIIVAGSDEIEDMEVTLRHDRLVTVMGVEITPEEVLAILQRLQFETIYEDGVYRVIVPVRRPDINIEVDLIEEVARLYGYDRIPPRLPAGQQQAGGRNELQAARQKIRHLFRGLGLNEVITYSLTAETKELEIDYPLTKSTTPISVAMPMSQEHAILRTNLLPDLVQVAAYNRNRGVTDVSIFELANVYLENHDHQPLPKERMQLAFLLAGNYQPANWQQAAQKADFFTAKGILTALLERLYVEDVHYEAAQLKGMHPGRTAFVTRGEQLIGVIGQLHPSLCEKYDLEDTVVCQLDLAALLSVSCGELVYQQIPRFPGISRDLALLIDENVPVGQVEAGIYAAAGELLKTVTLFDVFTGKQVAAGQKSIAFNLVYRSDERTLTDDEVQQVHQRVVTYLEETFGANLRQ